MSQRLFAAPQQVGVHLAGVARARRPHDRLHHHRNEEAALDAELRAREALGCDPDHGEAVAVHQQLAADDAGLAREARAPERVAQHEHRVAPRCHVVARGNQAAESRPHAEHLEVVPRHDQAARELGVTAAVEAHLDAAEAARPSKSRWWSRRSAYSG